MCMYVIFNHIYIYIIYIMQIRTDQANEYHEYLSDWQFRSEVWGEA